MFPAHAEHTPGGLDPANRGGTVSHSSTNGSFRGRGRGFIIGATMKGSSRALADYPAEMVRLACQHGQYRRHRLIE
jgi:hypothetical protein